MDSAARSSINGGGNVEMVPAPGGTSVSIQFGSQGGQVCVKPLGPCHNVPEKCVNVQVAPLPDNNLKDTIVCFENLPFYPDFYVDQPIYTPGTYVLQTNPPLSSYFGCDSMVRQKIVARPSLVHDDGTKYLCEGDCAPINGTNYCTTGGPFLETISEPGKCDSTLRFKIAVISSHAAIVPAQPQISCLSPTVQLSSAGSTTGAGVVRTWTNAAWATVGTDSIYAAAAAGTYHLIIRNNLGNTYCSDTATIVVASAAGLPGATAIGGTIGCANTAVTLQGSANVTGVSWSWAGPGITTANQSL